MPASFHPWSWVDDVAAIHPTGDRVLRVRGKHCRAWLNSLLTIDLRSPAPGIARYALLLTASGGIVSDAWVVDGSADSPQELALALPSALAQAVFHQLAKYHLNEDVLLAFDDSIRVLAVVGPRAREVVADACPALPSFSCNRLGTGGVDVWASAAEVDAVAERLCARAAPSGRARVLDIAWSAGRIALGVPLAGVDFDDGTSPHEAGLEGRAVSLSKGCYLGQERVARQQRQGGLRWRLVQFDIEGPEQTRQGRAVRDPDGTEVGWVTSCVPAVDGCASLPAIGYAKLTHAKPGMRVNVDERPARVRRVLGQAETAATTESRASSAE